uniref:DUF4371 domain-containing protein n=1 Tax=Amphimedon queenslandica TaxID=400682 RepID=A0A1X7TB94_AMPQE
MRSSCVCDSDQNEVEPVSEAHQESEIYDYSDFNSNENLTTNIDQHEDENMVVSTERYSIETVETSRTTPPAEPPAAQQSAVLTQPNISHTPRSEPTDLALGPKDRPKQPIITFPSRTFRTKKGAFSPVEVLLLCAQQDLPLRGHREYNSHNRGNFLEILSTIAKHDKIVEAKLKNAPQNAIYTSPEIQNQLLQLMGESVRSMVCRAVKEAVFFSLLVDETKDASKVEQISIVLRYVDINTASIYERFLTYVEAESQGAEQITHYITSTLKKYDIDLRNMASQGYDGASVMSGTNSGVQRRMRDFAPAAIDVHCNAHCLNLCLVDSVKSVSLAGLSDVLQSVQLNLDKAAGLVVGTIKTIESFRSDEEWIKLLSYAKSVADVHDISTHIPTANSSRQRRRAVPQRYSDEVVFETTGSRECPSEDDADSILKTNLYYPILDAVLVEFNSCFSKKNLELMKSLHACCPTADEFLEITLLKPLILAYNLDYQQLITETTLAKASLQGKKMEDVSDALLELIPLKVAFPNLIQLLQIALTISVSTAKCERTFSTLKRIKSYLRTTMSEERLNNMAILSIEHDLGKAIDKKEIICQFSQANRRIYLQL